MKSKAPGKQVKFEDEREGRIYTHNFFPVIRNNKVTASSDLQQGYYKSQES